MTIPSWWSAANNASHAYRDPASVASLLNGVKSSEPHVRHAAALALSRVVKALEDEPVEASVQLLSRALPELMPLLLDPDVDGQIISITRRIAPDAATVAALLQLLPTTPLEHRSLLLEALTLCDDDAWSSAVEQALVVHLAAQPGEADADCTYSAACGLRVRTPQLQRAESLHALARAALEGEPMTARQAVNALGTVPANGPLAPLAESLLEALLDTGGEPLRAHLAEVLGWGTATPAKLRLLQRCAEDPSEAVRSAAVRSLQCR